MEFDTIQSITTMQSLNPVFKTTRDPISCEDIISYLQRELVTVTLKLKTSRV